jgi:hypothetical protein
MEVVINRCFGGFCISDEAVELYLQKAELTYTKYNDEYYIASNGEKYNEYSFSEDEKRTDPILIQVVKELKEKSFGYCSKLKIVEIPDNIEFEISDYDGKEIVEEKHLKWY